MIRRWLAAWRAARVTTFAAAILIGCSDDTTASKPTCKLGPGDLVITEIMYNPAGDERTNEWFEIYNATSENPVLAGLLIKVGPPSNPKTVKIPSSLDPGIPPGGYLVVGNGTLRDGGFVPIGFAWPQLLLSNTGSTIVLDCGSEVVDTVSYGGSSSGWPVASDGQSIQFSGTLQPDATANDEPANWCRSADVPSYDGDANRGTPGAPNGSCAIAGQCLEGGMARSVRPPAAGDIVVTEVYANNPGVDDKNKEWLEIQALGDFDLNDLVFEHSLYTGGMRSYKVTSPDCVAVTRGTFAVLGGSKDKTLSGDVDVSYAFSSGLTLYNGAAKVEVKDADGQVLATANHHAAPSSGGVSVSLDQSQESNPSAAADASNWCNSSSTGHFEGTGTPGRSNDSCAAR